MFALLSLLQSLYLGLTAFLVYLLCLAVYRLYLSPIAKVPGPKLAALTKWYEVYYDLLDGPRFPWVVEDLHQKYGPIVRTGPNEVHINDPEFVPIHFTTREKRDKYKDHEWVLGMPESTIFTVDHDLHKIRRNAMINRFSRRSITAYEPILRQFVDQMCSRMEEYKASAEVLNLRLLFTCYSTDVITEYSTGDCQKLLWTPDLSPKWRALFTYWTLNCHFFKHFSWSWLLINNLPDRLVTWMSPDMQLVVDLQKANRAQIKEIILTKSAHKPPHPTIFHELLASSLPPAEKSPERLFQEGQSILGAGTESVSSILTSLIFYLLAHPNAWRKLRHEIATHAASPATTWAQLEQLPYLNAVIQEGLRIAPSMGARAPRVAHTELTYGGWTIPAGTAVSMNILFLNQHPANFAQAGEFIPERWLEKGEGGVDYGKAQEVYSFGKGTRMCAGINLGYAELYLGLAGVVRRFELELFETGLRDVEPVIEGFVPFAERESKGVRVLVR